MSTWRKKKERILRNTSLQACFDVFSHNESVCVCTLVSLSGGSLIEISLVAHAVRCAGVYAVTLRTEVQAANSLWHRE